MRSKKKKPGKVQAKNCCLLTWLGVAARRTLALPLALALVCPPASARSCLVGALACVWT